MASKKVAAKDWYPNDLLRERCTQYGIPMPSFWPPDNNCLVWRLPPVSVTNSGLIIPDDNQSPHILGILMAMGPRAMDYLYSNGFELGHTITFARFAGSEQNDHSEDRVLEARFLILKDRDLMGSVELREELASGKAQYVLQPDGRHCLQRKLLGGRKAKFLALAASTDSANEAAVAKKLAANS